MSSNFLGNVLEGVQDVFETGLEIAHKAAQVDMLRDANGESQEDIVHMRRRERGDLAGGFIVEPTYLLILGAAVFSVLLLKR